MVAPPLESTTLLQCRQLIGQCGCMAAITHLRASSSASFMADMNSLFSLLIYGGSKQRLAWLYGMQV